MGNSCHSKKKKQPQIVSKQIFQIRDIQVPQIISNNESQIVCQNNLISSIEQRKTPVSKKNCQEDENQQISSPNLHSLVFQEINQYKNKEDEEDEEDEVEQPQVPNKNDVVEQNLNANVDVDARVGEIQERINLNITPRQETIQLTSNTQIVPVIVQLQTFKNQTNHVKPYIDLICVVDVSGSMEGEKINLVKDSLRYIQKILGPNDRIAIVTFDTYAQVNLQWTRNTPKNKEKIKKAIVGIRIRNSTNIAGGVNQALKMIKNRKYKNPVTCMFVLSDGQDDDKGADDRVAKGLYQYAIKDSFVINTFGFGIDHDPKVMNNIANMKGGSFTFIDNIAKAAEYFILSMSGMLSVLAKDVELQVEENPKYKIQKIFGDDFLWKKLKSGGYSMTISYLQENDSKEFAFLLEIPANEKINFPTDLVVSARVQGILIEFNQDFQKQTELKLNFTLNKVQYDPIELVEVTFLRAKSGEIIGEAKEMALNRNYDQAQQHLNKMINEIEESIFKELQALKVLLKDLEEMKQICKPQLFEQKGVALMLNKQKNHIQQQKSLNNSVEWNSDQEEQMQNYRQGDLNLSRCRYSVDGSFNNERNSQISEIENHNNQSLQSKNSF